MEKANIYMSLEFSILGIIWIINVRVLASYLIVIKLLLIKVSGKMDCPMERGVPMI